MKCVVRKVKEYVCDFCKSAFPTRKQCEKHEKTHADTEAFARMCKPQFGKGDIVSFKGCCYAVMDTGIGRTDKGHEYLYRLERADEHDYDCGGLNFHDVLESHCEQVASGQAADELYHELDTAVKNRFNVGLKEFMACLNMFDHE